jgi:hypothetical protein
MSDVDEYIAKNRRRTQRWNTVGTIGKVIAGLTVAGGLIFVQCNGCTVSDERALEAIKASGMSAPKLGGADGLACQVGESSRHFEATNPAGERVQGTVCCGITGFGKGCTIRWGR